MRKHSVNNMTQVRPIMSTFNVALVSFLLYEVFGWFSFPIPQRLALTLLLVSLAVVANLKLVRFKPYSIRVAIKWKDLFSDYKLISYPEQEQQIQEYLAKLPKSEYAPLRDPFKFSVLQFRDFDDKLVYRSTAFDRGIFASKISLSADLNPLMSEIDKKDVTELAFADPVPRFFMVEGHEGLELGITVPESWWNRNRESCPKCLKETKGVGNVILTLAIVSYSEFAVHSQPQEYLLMFRSPSAKERHRFGWEIVQSNYIDRFEEAIEHKYFFLEHHEIRYETGGTH